jgi:hypothetical protein
MCHFFLVGNLQMTDPEIKQKSTEDNSHGGQQ